jgi:hypothetical protein
LYFFPGFALRGIAGLLLSGKIRSAAFIPNHDQSFWFDNFMKFGDLCDKQ